MKRIITILTLIAIMFIGCDLVYAIDRCQDYIIDVKNSHIRYFGPTFPYHYGIGQLKQESNCRSSVTAFDQGMGIAQFMPITAKEINRLMGEKLDPYNPQQAIRMQAFYMSRIHKQNTFPDKPLWATYQAYNGGWKWLYQERDRAKSTDWSKMRDQCRRKVITLKSGRLLDFCDVNYDYSKNIHNYAQRYKRDPDGMRYW